MFNLIFMSFFICILSKCSHVCFAISESPMTITKHVCGRLGKLGLNVLHADSMREMVSSKNELFLNINGISDLFVGLLLALIVMLIIATPVTFCEFFAY